MNFFGGKKIKESARNNFWSEKNNEKIYYIILLTL